MSAWPTEMTVAPLREWPGTLTAQRKRSQFGASLTTTLSQLRSELRLIGAEEVELLIAVEPGQFRLDGRPRAGAKVQHPGIVLTFETAIGRLSYPCDTFTTWEDNLRAVTLALEALRKVDRYGVTKSGEQYRGFLAIDAPRLPATVDEAREYLLSIVRPLDGDWTDAILIRRAKAITHPDAGGNTDSFQRVLDAERVIKEQA
jgi:hypothetical protein